MHKNQLLTLRFWLSVVAPAVLTVFYVWLTVGFMKNYGLGLFLLTPFILGLSSVFIQRPRSKREFGTTVLGNILSFVLIGFLVAAFQVEGLVCLAMAIPIAFPLSVLSILIGFLIIRNSDNIHTPASMLLLLVVSTPFILGFEASHRNKPSMHSVVTTVEIDAPIETVWKNVIEFRQIDERPDGIMSLGFAYPINARIDGNGVGAVRYCNFNTGPFVEPITAWKEPTLLAFDVREQPPIMIETGLTGNFQTAHMDYLKSQRGQFLLYEENGKTIVEGTTFYTHDIAPDWYWNIYSDRIIRQIHLRVLNHIKDVSERGK